MNLRDTLGLDSARPVLVALWATVIFLIIGGPILHMLSFRVLPALIQFFFSFVCHQVRDRSFVLWGYPVAVCHRCTGIYLGLFLGSLAENRSLHRSPGHRRLWVIASTVPLLLDALLPFTGLWANNWISRFLTGLFFGFVVSALLVRGFSELLDEIREPRLFRSAVPVSGEANHE